MWVNRLFKRPGRSGNPRRAQELKFVSTLGLEIHHNLPIHPAAPFRMKNTPLPNPPRVLSSRTGFHFIALALAAGIGASPAMADINTINQTVWKLQYGVSDAQMADANWLLADDDGDTLKNGAEIAAGTNPFLAASAVKITTITSTATTVSLEGQAIRRARFAEHVGLGDAGRPCAMECDIDIEQDAQRSQGRQPVLPCAGAGS